MHTKTWSVEIFIGEQEGRTRAEARLSSERSAAALTGTGTARLSPVDSDVPEIGVSSSMVRDRIAAGRPIRFLVPPGVEESLRREGLVTSPPSVPERKDHSRPRSS